jgi:hypothetical protein
MPFLAKSRAKEALKPEPAPTISADENGVLSIAALLAWLPAKMARILKIASGAAVRCQCPVFSLPQARLKAFFAFLC